MLQNSHATQNQNNNVINHSAPPLQLMPGAPSQHLTRPRAIVKSTPGDSIGALVNARRDPTSFIYSAAQDDNDASLTFKTLGNSTQGICPVHTRALVRREMKTSSPRPLALCPVSVRKVCSSLYQGCLPSSPGAERATLPVKHQGQGSGSVEPADGPERKRNTAGLFQEAEPHASGKAVKRLVRHSQPRRLCWRTAATVQVKREDSTAHRALQSNGVFLSPQYLFAFIFNPWPAAMISLLKFINTPSHRYQDQSIPNASTPKGRKSTP